jgi:nicotinate-nucleotide adenylyltransferase
MSTRTRQTDKRSAGDHRTSHHPPATTIARITPIKLPANAAGIVVFGGSFDPPHKWHTAAPAAVRRALERSTRQPGRWWIVYVPAARSPLKDRGPIAADADRLVMLRLATARMSRTLIWTDEIDRASRGARDGAVAPSFTVDTLERLSTALGRRAGSVKLRLLIGTDQAGAFHRWREPMRIIELAEPVVVRRSPMVTDAALRRALANAGTWAAPQISDWCRRIVNVPKNPVSSTVIRERLGGTEQARRRALSRGLRRLLAPGVRTYIDDHALYRSASPAIKQPARAGPG